MDELQTLIYNEGERLIPYVSHNEEELIRHRSSYAFFHAIITADLAALEKKSPISIIDLGFGTGYGCALLSGLPNSQVLGVDISPECEIFAAQYYRRKNVRYRIEDLTTFIPSMAAADFVVSRGVLEHVVDGLHLIHQIKYNFRVMIDVPYDEAAGNQHHALLGIREEAFAKFPEAELFYEDLDGQIFDLAHKPAKPNMILLVLSAPHLPKVAKLFSFPIPAVKDQRLELASDATALGPLYIFPSDEALEKHIRTVIEPLEVVAEIGTGIRPMNYFRPKLHLMVEPWKQYADILNYRYAQDKSVIVYQEKALEFLAKLADQSVDSIFLLDVIEHMEKDVGLQVLIEARRAARKQILIFTPFGYMPQHLEVGTPDGWGLGGAEMQEHLSGWVPEDFEGQGWSFYLCREYHHVDSKGCPLEKPFGAFYALCNLESRSLLKPTPMSEIRLALPSELEAEELTQQLQEAELQQITTELDSVYQVFQNLLRYYGNLGWKREYMVLLQKCRQQDKVSIILPTYNRAHFLKACIRSVLAQTHANFELIIVDDGSTDNTKDVVARFSDARICYLKQSNGGRSQARNRALELATGPYIAFLDSDDLYLPDKLALQVDYLKNHPGVAMVYTSAHLINEKDKPIAPWTYHATHSGYIYEAIAFTPDAITLPTVMTYKSVLEAVGGFDEKMYRFEDVDLWRRISKQYYIGALSQSTCMLKTHEDNVLHNQDPQAIIGALEYYAQKILSEDQKIPEKIKRAGLARLYKYYGFSFMTVPRFLVLGVKLIGIATSYKFNIYKKPLKKSGARSLILGLACLFYFRVFRRT